MAQVNHLIVGGLDPDTNLFTAAFYYLLENPKTYDGLRDEVRGRFLSWDQIIDDDAIQPLPYIHAVIEETYACIQTDPLDSHASVQEPRSMAITLRKE